jgi:hypothetical protein
MLITFNSGAHPLIPQAAHILQGKLLQNNCSSSCTHLIYSTPLIAKGILIYSNDLFVLQDGFVLRSDRAQIHGHEKWRSQDSPQCHLRLTLFVAQSKVPDN